VYVFPTAGGTMTKHAEPFFSFFWPVGQTSSTAASPPCAADSAAAQSQPVGGAVRQTCMREQKFSVGAGTPTGLSRVKSCEHAMHSVSSDHTLNQIQTHYAASGLHTLVRHVQYAFAAHVKLGLPMQAHGRSRVLHIAGRPQVDNQQSKNQNTEACCSESSVVSALALTGHIASKTK